MAELRPYPFAALLTRMLRELDERDSIFDLPRRNFFLGAGDQSLPGQSLPGQSLPGPSLPGRDLSVRFHGKRAASPLGPAAGPHTQMAQNIVLSWLAGCRIMELKTVQILDELAIPRPCIDMQTVGYNVEWSQELTLEQSLEEYVKAAMLIDILVASGAVEVAPGYRDVIFDMSVGYDLAGIRSERVQAFIDGMADAGTVIDRLRAQIPAAFSRYRDLDFTPTLSSTLTLSTFHGCPPDEIERIIEFLLEEKRLHCVIKLNPTLLGEARVRELLHGEMGYTDVHVPSAAFAKDATWDQAVGFVERLGVKADSLGLGLGVKFSNTLIVENHRKFFPASEKEMYLSGPPLHVLAMNLVQKFRGQFGDRYPISFSAGIDRGNFTDAVALGLTPITVCSDLLQPGGYARASRYLQVLDSRMAKAGARTIPEYILSAYGHAEAALERLDLAEDVAARCKKALADRAAAANRPARPARPARPDRPNRPARPDRPGRPAQAGLPDLTGLPDLAEAAGEHFAAWVSQALLLNTEEYVARATGSERYKLSKNSKAPRKLGSHLELFDCVTCNKCVPVCPNNANFLFELPPLEVPLIKARREQGAWVTRSHGVLAIKQKEQYANFADFCNDCGNCDVFCPEDGGPYKVKPRFFGSLADFRELAHLDGFFFVPQDAAAGNDDDTGDTTHARIDGRELRLHVRDRTATFSGDGFAVTLHLDHLDAPEKTLDGTATVEVDLGYLHIIQWMRDAVFRDGRVNYLNALTAS